ncbi:hypothetical protein CK203_109496 [Vitis vinifera]|uniref:Uncharacterized protein n=1 Tax=Vitis vinifera TaxID=29760 RepID=A0A438CHI9_VITVI|nr:hypothetical protein CK203_109496 [Vitis vinifera]
MHSCVTTFIHYSTGLRGEESFRGLVQDFEGYFFGPHHLIMVALLYFEEKVHKKKLERADAIPLLFPRLLCQILSIWGIHQILSGAQAAPQPAEIPAARRASPRHIPEGIPIAPTISRAPPVTPASSEPSTSAEPRMAFPFQSIRVMPLTATLNRVSEQPCSGDGSYSSMPGADVDHPGSAHCHLEAAPASSRSSISCEHLTPTTAVPHSQATEPQALLNYY